MYLSNTNHLWHKLEISLPYSKSEGQKKEVSQENWEVYDRADFTDSVSGNDIFQLNP